MATNERNDKAATPDKVREGTGKQMDDNIDDLGRRKDGTKLDQPVKNGGGDRSKPE